MEKHYVYIIRNPAYNQLYKIGKTRFPIKRYNSYNREYQKGFHYLILLECENCHSLEKKLLKKFNRQFVKADCALEWFVGDFSDIIRCFLKVCRQSLDIDENYENFYEVQDIIASKVHPKYKYLQFKVIWSDGEVSWEPLECLDNVCAMVKKVYQKKYCL